MPSGLYADTTLRELLGLEVGDALIASGGGGLEYETAIFNNDRDNYQPTIYFQNEHSREPDIIVMQMVLTESVTLAATDIMCFLFSYIDRFQKVNEIADGNGYHGTVVTANYAASGNYYSNNQLALKYGFDYSGTLNYQCASYYVKRDRFTPKQPSSTVNKYFKANTGYKWIAIWLPVEETNEATTENSNSGNLNGRQ